jgi:glutathione S-transferase
MLELIQFRYSPYNEKVRWALDLKRVPHTRRSVLPGPHLRAVRKLTGRTTTPVLVADGVAIDGSTRIIEWLDTHYPEPRLIHEGDRKFKRRLDARFRAPRGAGRVAVASRGELQAGEGKRIAVERAH